MKYKYYCRVKPDSYVVRFLEQKNVKYKIATITEMLIFDIYSDTEQSEEFLEYIQRREGNLITKSSVFSEQEMENANWYLLYATRMGMETKDVQYTYDAKCLYSTAYGIHKYHHLDQVNPFVSSKTPKWKNRYNFCSEETGFMTKIFCSDFAKEAIVKNQITGVDFIPVLKKDLKTNVSDVNQLMFPNKLPLEAYTFIGKYKEKVCPFCGRKKYVFEEPNCDIIRLNTDIIPEGIDAFGSKIIVGEGFGEELVVISKKFYNLLIKGLNENPKHFILFPIA